MTEGIPLKIAALTVNRSDFGRMFPIYRKIMANRNHSLRLAATGSHFSQKYGGTLMHIQASGVPLTKCLPLMNCEDPVGSAAEILRSVGEWLREEKPDLILLLGDRYEMLAAAQAAMLLEVPIVHIGGGYITRGSLDDRIRHAITKLADFHLVASRHCASRVLQMGEMRERVYTVGAPDIEVVKKNRSLSRAELLTLENLDPKQPFLLVTIHPETQGNRDMSEAFAVLRERPEQILITAPAPDTGAEQIFQLIETLQQERPGVRFVPSLGDTRYISAMYHALAMFGNSSSGIIESSAVPVPAVNIGSRQEGREHARNVISVTVERDAMAQALDRACTEAFREESRKAVSPYGDGRTATRVAAFLDAWGRVDLRKAFQDIYVNVDGTGGVA